MSQLQDINSKLLKIKLQLWEIKCQLSDHIAICKVTIMINKLFLILNCKIWRYELSYLPIFWFIIFFPPAEAEMDLHTTL